MFDLHAFVKTNLLNMIGHASDYAVRQYAASWYNKAVLTENDVLVIDNAINLKNERTANIQ